jgi:phosphoenolpyruvate carboxykinase (ATP)
MWDEPVRRRGGLPLASLAEAEAADLAAARFVAVLCHDDGVVPAVAMLEPAQAAAQLALVDDGPPEARAAAANRFLERLRASPGDSYLLKSGRVGGGDPERSIEIGEHHATAILDAIGAGTIEWELDPDFGYRVAAAVPGIEGRDRFLLIPRFLYARTERVYEYAALVPELKRERAAKLSALAGLDPVMIDAIGRAGS